MSNLITLEELKSAVPGSLRPSINQQLVDTFNALQGEEGYLVRENLISYSQVLQEGKFKVQDYFKAVIFTTHKMMGCSVVDAYIKTFPDRFNRLVSEGKTKAEIYPYASIYNKNQLVTKIGERTLVPPKILYADVYHQSIQEMVHLMKNGKSEKVRVMAATELIKELSPNDGLDAKIQIDIKQDTALEDLKRSFALLAQEQQELIRKGVSTKTIAERGIVDVIDVNE